MKRSNPNAWASLTTVRQPDHSLRKYYYNASGSLLLLEVSEAQVNAPPKVWYPVCQRFDINSRMVLSASSAAVDSVDAATPELFTLRTDAGLLKWFGYDEAGNLVGESLQHGTAGPFAPVRQLTYSAYTIGAVTIHPLASEDVYLDSTDPSKIATTSYSYIWFQDFEGMPTFQRKSVTTTLPVVSVAENGNGKHIPPSRRTMSTAI